MMNNRVLDTLRLTAKSHGIDIGDYRMINGDGYLFDNGMVISGFEMAKADTQEEMLALIAGKLKLKLAEKM